MLGIEEDSECMNVDLLQGLRSGYKSWMLLKISYYRCVMKYGWHQAGRRISEGGLSLRVSLSGGVSLSDRSLRNRSCPVLGVGGEGECVWAWVHVSVCGSF